MSALRSLARVSCLAAAVVACAPAPAAANDRETTRAMRRGHPLNPFDQGVVDRLRERAAARLEEPECGKVLTDFTDRSGRTLRENLEPLGVSASEYLRQLEFVDGRSVRQCRDGLVMMTTEPGVPRVSVCPAEGQLNSRLSRLEFRSGSLAEAMVIHEMLHTLGLGENPPSTFEITKRVRDRCR